MIIKMKLWIIYICVGIGIVFVIHFTYLFVLSKRSKNWKTTEGEIVSSKMQKNDFDEGTMYKAVIQYKYAIEEKEYFSDRIFFGDYIGKNFSKSVKVLVNKYANEKKVLVYYNPQNHNKSVLETGVQTVIYRELFVGILLLLLSVIMFVKDDVIFRNL